MSMVDLQSMKILLFWSPPKVLPSYGLEWCLWFLLWSWNIIIYIDLFMFIDFVFFFLILNFDVNGWECYGMFNALIGNIKNIREICK